MYPQLAIEAAAQSNVGRRGSHNEVSFAALPCVGLFMVADGLGGNAGGEVASRMAIEVVKGCFEVDEDLEETWPYGTGSAHDRDEVRLLLSVRRANRVANEHGGPDNVTCVLARQGGGAKRRAVAGATNGGLEEMPWVGQHEAWLRRTADKKAHGRGGNMEDMLGAMWLVSPIGLAMIACVAIGFAVTAREALGRERGLREAREHAHDEEEAALTDAKEQAAGERDRYRRLLDCHVDATLAELRDARGRPVPWPGRVLESFCATTPSWRRKLGESTGLEPREVERLLRSDLPMTPGLARQLETFTGTPARYWERLWRLHDDRRTDAEDTVVVQVGEPVTRRESAASPAPLTVPPRALDTPPPVVPSPELAVRSPQAKLPPPPLPQLRPPRPVRAVTGEELARRAAPLTSFPLQPDEGGTSAASASDWEEAERSPLNTTLPGVGRHG